MEILFNISRTVAPTVPIGSMRVSGANPGVAADVYIRFWYNGSYVVPETLIASNVAPAGSFSYIAAFPKGADGKPLSGVFVYDIIFKTPGTGTVLSTTTLTSGGPTSYPSFPTKLSSSIKVDLINGFFTVTDDTVLPLGAGTNHTRTWTITAPPYGVTPGAVSTGSDQSIAVSFNQFNAAFSVSHRVLTIITRLGTIDLVEEYELASAMSFTPRATSLAPYKDCIKNELARLKKLLCNGFDRLPSADKTKLMRMLVLLAEHDVSTDVLDYDWALSIFPEIKKLTPCCAEVTESATDFSLPNGADPVATVWANFTGFVNSFSNGIDPLRWRVDSNNELRVFGRLSIPNGLLDISDTVVSTTILPKPLSIHKVAVFDANGSSIGYVFVSATTGELTFSSIGVSSNQQIYVNYRVPLD